jgi:hypothetical protein
LTLVLTNFDTFLMSLGWISDMNPLQKSSKIAKKYGEMFRNPLDEIDGAARVLDPVCHDFVQYSNLQDFSCSER